MTIQITKPEIEALIKQRLESGEFKDAEDVILQALKLSHAAPPQTAEDRAGGHPAAEEIQEDARYFPRRRED